MAVGAAVTYGVINDQFLAHLCVQYFTIGHVDYTHTGRPEILAFEWGFLGSWWVGLTLGLFVAVVATVGPAPRLGPADFSPPLTWLLVAMFACSALAWSGAFILSSTHGVYIDNVVRPGVNGSQRYT